jgi:predicted O-methyltransferase YrrM
MKQFSDIIWLWEESETGITRSRKVIRQHLSEAELLWKYCTLTSGGIVEIGTYHGGGTTLLLEASSHTNRRVSSIDRFSPSQMAPVHRRDDFHESCKKVFEKNKNRLSLIVEYSKDVVIYHSYDLLFIDGNHSYEGVKTDLEVHFPRLEIGGIVVFHDYGSIKESHKQVTKAVDEWVDSGHIKLLEVARSLAAFRKIL